MTGAKRGLALLLVLLLLAVSAGAESWPASKKNIPRIKTLLGILRKSCAGPLDADAADAVLEKIRLENEADYAVALAVTDHWKEAVMDTGYRIFLWRDEKEAGTLLRSGLDFGGRHAFVVLGYRLDNGKMTDELKGRCQAAAAAARSYPGSILVCTGGATGTGNPTGNTEAAEMKKYLVRTCGIDAERIFTDEKSLTTLDNAVNSLWILNAQGIESMTLVTSDYHQRWGQIVFNAVAAIYANSTGTRIRIVGNYNYATRREYTRTSYCGSALSQLENLIGRQIVIEP